MQSSKLRVRVLCAVALASCAGVACDQALAPQYQHSGTSTGGSSGSDGNPVSSGSAASPSGGSDPVSSSGSAGTAGSDSAAGTAGTAGASAGGSGGVNGTAGASGSVGTAGSGGSGGAAVDLCLHTGARTKTDLTPTNGRVECSTNDFGIEGDWKVNSADPLLITPTFTGGMVCGKGSIAQVVATTTSGGQPDFGRYWGGGLALILHNEGAGFLAQPYNASANGLGGISLKITANTGTIPAQMRFKFKMTTSNESYCKEVDNATSGQTVVLKTGDAIHNCWAPDNVGTLDVTTLENYEVQVVSQTTMAVPFDFCLSEITALGM